jgi:hypothetical protein
MLINLVRSQGVWERTLESARSYGSFERIGRG